MTKKQLQDHLEAMIAWRDGELANYIDALKAKADGGDVTTQDADAENPTVPLPPKPPGVS